METDVQYQKQVTCDSADSESRKNNTMRIWKILIPILIIFALIAAGWFVYQNRQYKKDVEAIENITRDILAAGKCVDQIFDTGSDLLRTVVLSGQITSSGYIGEEWSPDEIKEYVETQIEALNSMRENANGDFSEDRLRLVDHGLAEKYLSIYLSERKNSSIVLSKLSTIETMGGAKMWKYTEMITGIEFMATKDKNGLIRVQTTDSGSIKFEEQHIEHINTYNGLLDEYKHMVFRKEIEEREAKEREEREAKERQQRRDDELDALFGLGLMGLFL